MQSDNSHSQFYRQAAPVTGRKAICATLLFVAIGFLACAMPDYPEGFYPQAFARLPLEVPLVALTLLWLPSRLALMVAAVATLAVFLLLFLKLADVGVISAFQRRFNPYLDIKMMYDGWNVLSGSVGKVGAAAVIGLVSGLIAMVLSLFCWAALQLNRFGAQARRIALAGFALLMGVGVVLWAAGPRAGAADIAEMRVATYLQDRLSLVSQSISDIRAFEAQLGGSAGAIQTARFDRVAGRDVIVIFFESYGRSAVEDPRYADMIKPRLENVQQKLQAAGFATASGWTRSPTVGGLSWLAHGTLMSGLWVDNQARYDLLMSSRWPSLNRAFGAAGWQTVAIMPAITMDWPEAAYYGYDTILAAKDMGYRGKPFNWITMPDQYTLSAFERLARQPARAAGKPVMAEIALISSHAPWTPVPKLIDWASVGDGIVFNSQAESGDAPAVVWADPDRVRRQYIETIDYTLQTLGDYIARFGEDAVFVVLGDHQPASIVTGPDASRAVPVHIISRDATLVESFRVDGFTAGMTPDNATPEGSMDRLRDILIQRFTGD
ncbi:sulfatase [Rhizobium sp. RU36D]|uniref:sulfatase n=1 Tax=Rhizobium sp. RU36D TaxID=1907415 RepID=UPI0009D7C687|nr:sulfatase [Rhizobium sp. RU36D]SMC53194.1 Phosphoglycerol transferase MdoB [Rhizobium sp. RU36D]